jgi:putative ABC transport system permease protein
LREIGIRKVLGGLKLQLILQFISESILLVFFSTVLALFIYGLTRGLFSSLLGKEMPLLSGFPFYFAFFPLLLVAITGFMAGLYPAFVLSSMKAVESLKGKLGSVKEKVALRKLLVAFQFGLSAIVFTGAIIISKQVKLFFSRDLGYNKDFVLAAQVPRDWSIAGVSRMDAMRNQFAAIPEVKSITLSFEIPDGNNSGNAPLYRDGADSTTAITSQILYTDEHYASTYDIPMAAGIFYCSPGAYTDSTKLVINEAEAKALGWANAGEAVGKKIRFPGSSAAFTIAGVTKDFHFGTMQKEIQPATFVHLGISPVFRFFSFKLKPGDMGAAINAIQKKWSALMPGTPFEYKFMDETLRNLYKSEIQLKKASFTATILSLIIALLGVIGLVSMGIQKRTKEIGIRKVLGSSVRSIIILFMKEFLVVIGISGLIACPIAWLIMRGWLNDYAYRVTPGLTPFIISVLGLAFVTAIMISLQTVKAAMDNPVKSLRSE